LRDFERARQYGVEGEILDGNALIQREPHLSGEFAGAIHFTEPGFVLDPGGLAKAYATLFQRKGGRFVVGDLDLEGYNKFIPYLLHPESVYSISVGASKTRAKVSLGTNPWNQATADKNLASLAEKYGGGGHPRVAAISFEPDDLPRAREVARELVAVLRA